MSLQNGFYFILAPVFNKIVDFLFDGLTRKKIVASQYDKFIFVKGITKNEAIFRIKEFGKLSGNSDYTYNLFDLSETGDWIIIKSGENTMFFTYHNLIGWLLKYDPKNHPTFCLGFARHKSKFGDDYFCLHNLEEEADDFLVGVRRKEQKFIIELTKPYKETAFLKLRYNFKLSFEEVVKIISEKGLDIRDLDNLNYSTFQIKINN